VGSDLRRTVIIENVAPTVDGGRYAVKREVGDVVDVEADIFKEGHDVIVAVLKYRRAREAAWREAPMSFVDNDRWRGRFTLDAVDRWQFTIEAMADPFRSWLVDLAKRVEAGQDVARELLEGAGLVRAAADRASGNDAMALRDYASRLASGDRQDAQRHERAQAQASHHRARVLSGRPAGRIPSRMHLSNTSARRGPWLERRRWKRRPGSPLHWPRPPRDVNAWNLPAPPKAALRSRRHRLWAAPLGPPTTKHGCFA